MAVAGEAKAIKPDTQAPVIVDLGKKKKKEIKRLRNGTGKLMNRVAVCIQELKASGSVSESAQTVIVVVKEKRKSTGLLSM